MTLNIPPGFGRLAHRFSFAGDAEPMFVTFGWELGLGDPNLATIAESFHGAMETWHVARQIANLRLEETIVTLVTAGAPDELVANYVESIPGAASNIGILPLNSAYMIHKRTGNGGRHNRGRIYYPCVREGDADDLGRLLAGVVTAWNTSANTYISSCNDIAGVEGLVLLHSIPEEGVNTGVVRAPTRITTMNIDPVIATQRRRLRP